jgi:hypothetical protein
VSRLDEARTELGSVRERLGQVTQGYVLARNAANRVPWWRPFKRARVWRQVADWASHARQLDGQIAALERYIRGRSL